jgi:uncharacterized protein (DUF779 family)
MGFQMNVTKAEAGCGPDHPHMAAHPTHSTGDPAAGRTGRVEPAGAYAATMRVEATESAERTVERMLALRSGALTITIGTGCCESTAPFLYEDFWPGPDQAQIGSVAGVPVYAPAYLRDSYPGDDGVVIDVVEAVTAESLSVETELDCRLILRGFGVDLGIDPGACAVPDAPAAPSIATGGPSRVVGELPEALRRGGFR